VDVPQDRFAASMLKERIAIDAVQELTTCYGTFEMRGDTYHDHHQNDS
jgi:hypothetical protein